MMDVTPAFLNEQASPSRFAERMFKQTGTVYRELENRQTLCFELNKHHYFIKKHFGIGLKEYLKNIFQFKKPVLGARNEYEAIKKLGALGVATPVFQAFYQKGIIPFRQHSFIITKALTDSMSLETALNENNQAVFQHKRTIIKSMANSIRLMHGAGTNHRDCYLCHFLLDMTRLKQGDIKLAVIDLHRAQIRKNLPIRWQIKDLAGLYFSSIHHTVSKRDRFRFLKHYFQRPLRDIIKQHGNMLKAVEQKALLLHKKHQEN
jgi:heptose I phosphotransferase